MSSELKNGSLLMVTDGTIEQPRCWYFISRMSNQGYMLEVSDGVQTATIALSSQCANGLANWIVKPDLSS